VTGGRALGWTATLGLGLAGLVVALQFFAATTFIGDDHVFLVFARHVGNPFLPFVRDLHGGEYYRPLWMTLWWLLGQAQSVWPFAVGALALHTAAALLVASGHACSLPRSSGRLRARHPPAP